MPRTMQTYRKLVETLGHWLANIKLMAALVSSEGEISFANTAFTDCFGKFLPDSTAQCDLTALLCAPLASSNQARIVNIDEHPYTYVKIHLPEDESPARCLLLVCDLDAHDCESERNRQLTERIGLLESILDCSADGLMFVDPEGVITYVNSSYEEIHHISATSALGQHVTDIVDNTRMHLVAKTGTPEIDDVHLENERRYVVSRTPVYRNGRLIGAIGQILFRDIDRVGQLASKVARLKIRLEHLRQRKGLDPDIRYFADDIVAVAPASAAVKATALRIAPTGGTVLLLGESGVGKEIYAHAIHATSQRAGGPFVRVNCSAIAESLFESELFGYTEGAFTGAVKGGKAGKFELANFGTIFLDEIADMPIAAQAKLLRVLQEKEIEKVGGEKQTRVDVRVIAATNQDLEKLVAQGKFRKDLYFRLNVLPLTIPPLRERQEDIPVLVSVLWEQLQRERGASYQTLSADAHVFLQGYEWPGNVRELRNVLERAISIVRDNTVTSEHLRILLLGDARQATGSAPGECNLQKLVETTERRAIVEALAKTNNNRTHAAQLLGITRPLLYKKMGLYSIH